MTACERFGLAVVVWLSAWHTPVSAESLMITGTQVNVYAGPGRTFEILQVVNTGEYYELLQTNAAWYQISVDGTLGWVAQKAARVAAAKDVPTLLTEADAYFDRQQFTTPPEANAYDIYRQVLERDPKNARALKRIAQMARTYQAWANRAEQQGDTAKANIFYERYLFLKPDDAQMQERLRTLTDRVVAVNDDLPTVLTLRRDPARLTAANVVAMIKAKHFHHPADWSKYQLTPSLTGTFRHDYVAREAQGVRVVHDYATKLLWQQDSPKQPLTWREAQARVAQLNAAAHAGFSDWRLPTIEELASLLEPVKSRNSLYLAAVFGSNPLWCWSVDQGPEPNSAWYVSFNSGGIQLQTIDNPAFVLLVRTNE